MKIFFSRTTVILLSNPDKYNTPCYPWSKGFKDRFLKNVMLLRAQIKTVLRSAPHIPIVTSY